ncbi:MAG: DNA polymerase, partial [Verrucomicrobiota bacterium]
SRLNGEMLKTTGGIVGKCTEVALLVQWIRSQGVEIKGAAKADVLDALESRDLPAAVRKALELRKEAARSSTAKLLAMQDRASADSRVRGIHQYHGASTGRWAGRGVQPQNLPRPRPGIKPRDVHDMIGMLKNPELLDMSYGPIMDAMADCVRGMIVPEPGHDLIAVDFSAIEARVLAWLAGEERVLDIFRTHGRIYEAAAAGIYHCDMKEVTKDQRQIGKVAVLALGYGGGVGAFQSMARNYNITIKDIEADDIKRAWRLANPAIVKYWWALERAGMDAVTQGGTHTAGPVGRQVAFKKVGSFLWCRLPSGRVLCYPYPEVRALLTPNGSERDSLTYMTVVSNIKAKLIEDPASSGTWKRVATYGGSLAENVTQAVARDLLASAMLRLAEHDAKIVLHCHDEVVIEAPICSWSVSEVEALMAEAPAWATGLPLAAEGWRGTRYRK